MAPRFSSRQAANRERANLLVHFSNTLHAQAKANAEAKVMARKAAAWRKSQLAIKARAFKSQLAIKARAIEKRRKERNAQIRQKMTPEQRALASLHRNGKYMNHAHFRWNALTGRAQVGKIPVRGMGLMSNKPSKAVWRNVMI